MQRTQVIVTVLDDLDLRGDLETPATEHHKLEFDGHGIEIDLSEPHSKELAEFLAPYLEAGHTVKYPSKPYVPKTELGQRMSEARKVNKAARDWAEAIGRKVPSRGTHAFERLVEDYRDARSKGLVA